MRSGTESVSEGFSTYKSDFSSNGLKEMYRQCKLYLIRR